MSLCWLVHCYFYAQMMRLTERQTQPFILNIVPLEINCQAQVQVQVGWRSGKGQVRVRKVRVKLLWFSLYHASFRVLKSLSHSLLPFTMIKTTFTSSNMLTFEIVYNSSSSLMSNFSFSEFLWRLKLTIRLVALKKITFWNLKYYAIISLSCPS